MAGASMDIGMTLLVYNLMRTALSSRQEKPAPGDPALATGGVQ
jgi:hypothetical protein